MFIWEWVLGWIGTGDVIVFSKIGKLSKTHNKRPVAKTNYNRAVVKTNYRRDLS